LVARVYFYIATSSQIPIIVVCTLPVDFFFLKEDFETNLPRARFREVLRILCKVLRIPSSISTDENYWIWLVVLLNPP